jgi:hypothetical protein
MNSTSCICTLSKTRASLTAVAAAAAVGLALLLGSGTGHAQDNQTGPGAEMPCTPIGQDGPPTIPEGTVVKVGGDYYQCLRGFWWKMPRAVTAGQQPVTASLTNSVGRTPALNLAR